MGCWNQPIWSICSSNWILSPDRIDWTKNIGNHLVVVAIFHVVSGHLFRGYSLSSLKAEIYQGTPSSSLCPAQVGSSWRSSGWLLWKKKKRCFLVGFHWLPCFLLDFHWSSRKKSLKISMGEIGWTFKTPQTYPAAFRQHVILEIFPQRSRDDGRRSMGFVMTQPKKTQLEVLKKKHNFGKFITGSLEKWL